MFFKGYMKPKLEIALYHGDGKYDWALFRMDREKPMCSGISKAHAEHLRRLVGREAILRETIPPIKNWYEFEEIVDVDEKGLGINKND